MQKSAKPFADQLSSKLRKAVQQNIMPPSAITIHWKFQHKINKNYFVTKLYEFLRQLTHIHKNETNGIKIHLLEVSFSHIGFSVLEN